jgi:zona occludens toxin
MSIVAYVGLPGHGKSFGVVQNVILPSLKNKRLVYTNIPMNNELCLKDFGMCVVPFDIADVIKNPNWWKDIFAAGAILVLDEVWRLWPMGLKANSVRESDKEFLAEHRHLVGENGFSTEIYLVTQDLSQISSFARVLVETTFRMVKLSTLGLDKSFRVDVYNGPVTGAKPPVSARDREIFGGKFKQETYKYYKSHTKSETGQAGDETRTDKRFNLLGRLSIKLGFLLFIFCLVVLYFGAKKVKSYYVPEPEIVPSEVQQKSPLKNQNEIQKNNQQKPAQATNVSKIAGFLSKAKTIHVSHTTGGKGLYIYFYKVVFDSSEVTMSSIDLKRLGYLLTPINDCLVKISGYDYSGFIMCPKPSRSSGGLMAGVAKDLVSTSQPVEN